ncbi:MAG: tetratricopeptide repeat protein [Bacteroidia bacterium]|nr:tetratricopeptide repeat protein [Bacteroidia bacterium]
MNSARHILILTLIILSVNNVFGQSSIKTSRQDHILDSLNILYKNASQDSIRISLLNEEIGYYFERKNPDSAIFYYQKAIKLANKNILELSKNKTSLKIRYLKLKANSLRYIGIIYYEQGAFDKAIQFVLKSLKIYDELITFNDSEQHIIDCKNGMTQCYVPLGNIQYDQGNFGNALNYFLKALKIHEELDNTQQISGCYVNIGNVYFDQGLNDKATDCYFKSLKIAEKLGDKKAMSKCYNNIGNILLLQGEYNLVLNYYIKSLKIKEEFEDKYGIAMVNANIAQLHVFIADSIYNNKENKRNEHLVSAVRYGLKAIEIAHEINAIPLENPTAFTLMSAYKKLNNFEKSLEYAEIYIATKDSMFKEEKTKSVADAEKRFESEKKQLIIDKLNKEQELNLSELFIQKEHGEKQRITILFIIGGLLLVVIFAIFIVHRLRISRKQKLIIENQKLVVDEKNVILNQQIEEIITQRDEIEAQRDLVSLQKKQIENIYSELTDSIHYAEKIQKAVLPSPDFMGNLLKDYFILFKPKDIVSGDFYYVAKRNNIIIAAVADCTGHGVPGAFMSMLGVSFLNEIIAKENMKQADHVLNELRNHVVNSLQQKGIIGEQKDGMDISIIAYDTITHTLQYSGANSPLYIISSKTNELKEIKPDKMPVSIYINMKSFTNHIIKLEQGDTIYLASDGYSDQFGGESGKKFYSKQLKQLLQTNCNKPLKEQGELLDKAIENWRNAKNTTYQQTDDITVMGIKF